MRKSLLLLSIALVLHVCVLSAGKASAQPSDELMQQQKLIQTIMDGSLTPRFLQPLLGDEMVIPPEQNADFHKKMSEAIMPFEEGLQKEFGNPGNFKREQLSDLAEAVTGLAQKVNDLSRKVMKETFSTETVTRIDELAFQQYGGLFGGALNVDNLAPLHLSDEQREKAAQIVEKLNRERFELAFSLEIESQSGEEPDVEKMKEAVEKIISLTRRGQGEIETLLTDAQKKRAAELMAEVPEKYRFLSDYLTNRPWRLDESNWKPGDGAPPNLENYPGEMRPERPPNGRPFPGQ